MTDLGDSFRDYRDHQRDCRDGIVRCRECGNPTAPSHKRVGFQWCAACKRMFRRPRYIPSEEVSDGRG